MEIEQKQAVSSDRMKQFQYSRSAHTASEGSDKNVPLDSGPRRGAVPPSAAIVS